jgi:transcriptional regulator with XRE-family HTH domain
VNRIKDILEEKNMTQVHLGEKIGKSFETINAYCSNRRQPSLDILFKISLVLDCSVKDLLVDNKNLNLE